MIDATGRHFYWLSPGDVTFENYGEKEYLSGEEYSLAGNFFFLEKVVIISEFFVYICISKPKIPYFDEKMSFLRYLC